MVLQLILACFLFILTSCSGGGGGGNDNVRAYITNPIEQNSWSDLGINSSEIELYKTPEYNISSGYDLVNVAHSYAILDYYGKDQTGEGVSVVVTDTGLDINHGEFFNHYNDEASKNYINIEDDVRSGNHIHGTQVSSIISAKKDYYAMHGIAYKNKVTSFKIIDDNNFSDEFYNDIPDNSIMNASWGFDGVLNNAQLNEIRNQFTNLKNRDILTIAATGNDSDSSPSYPARLAGDNDLQGSIIAVGAINKDKNIADFSNHCGDAKNYCLVAPGVDIYTALSSDQDYTYYNPEANGTSFAVPHVTGAAALLKSAWPILTSSDISEILLTTATDLGLVGVDEVYGRGLLNVAEAMSAQGANAITSGININSKGYDLRDSLIESSSIFGDAFINIALNLNEAVFFDDYGRDYKAHLNNKIIMKNNSLNQRIHLINNYISSNVMPYYVANINAKLNFNVSHIKDNNIIDYQNGHKFSVIDNSKNNDLNHRNGFSFTQNFNNFSKDLSLGFAYNFNEIEYNNSQKLSNGGRFADFFFANPFSYFTKPYHYDSVNSRNFNQLFLSKSFLNNNLNFTSSFQITNDNKGVLQIDSKQNEISDMSISYKFNNDIMLASFGSMNEFDNNILDSKNSGAFSSANNVKTNYLKLVYQKNIAKNFDIISTIAHSTSKISGNDIGIFRSFENVAAKSLGFSFIHNNFLGGRVGLNYVEPMTIYKGRVKYDIAIARDIERGVIRKAGYTTLKPRGKERNIELFFNKNINNNININFEALYQINPNNNYYQSDNKLIYLSLNRVF